MDDSSGVKVLEGFGELVDDEADVHVFEYAFGDDVVQVCLHELEEQVDVFVVVGADCLVQLYDVWVVELLQDLNFAVGALSVGGVLEGVEDLLEREDALG